MTKDIQPISRRNFVRQTSGAAAGLSLLSAMQPNRVMGANEALNLGCIGLGGMGTNDMKKFLLTEKVNIAAICDVDSKRAKKAAMIAEDELDVAPKIYGDYRKLLEDKNVDAVLVATPDHWHTIITMDACNAGKDVYVEKPCSHTVTECLAMAKCAKENKSVVQHGTQQRSGKHFHEARDYVRSGKLGKIGLVRCWAAPGRGPLESVPDSAPPAELDYDFWQGPAQERPFNKNRTHYNWRFFWEYGTGDMGNWGVHWLDIALWYLDLGYPKTTSSSGGNYVHRDFKETPDTQIAVYDYPEKDLTVVWEMRLWSKSGFFGRPYGTAFYGEKETLVVDREGWESFASDTQEKVAEASEVTDISACSVYHMDDFIECCKTRKQPVASIHEGAVSAAVSLLGNVAFLGANQFEYDADQNKTNVSKLNDLLTKKYRNPWKLP